MNTNFVAWRPDRPNHSDATAGPFAYPDFPIEQHIRSIARCCQRAFADDIARRLQGVAFDDAFVHATDDGLVVLARHEQALREPVDAIVHAHGIGLHLDAPRARQWPGLPPRPPVMHLELRIARGFARPVFRELRARDAHLLAVRIGMFSMRIRAEALQADLFGFREWIGRLTDSRARLALRPSRDQMPVAAPAGNSTRSPRWPQLQAASP